MLAVAQDVPLRYFVYRSNPHNVGAKDQGQLYYTITLYCDEQF